MFTNSFGVIIVFDTEPPSQLPDPPEIVAVLVCPATVILSVLPLYDNALKRDDAVQVVMLPLLIYTGSDADPTVAVQAVTVPDDIYTGFDVPPTVELHAVGVPLDR